MTRRRQLIQDRVIEDRDDEADFRLHDDRDDDAPFDDDDDREADGEDEDGGEGQPYLHHEADGRWVVASPRDGENDKQERIGSRLSKPVCMST
jgi:hypothetical protein